MDARYYGETATRLAIVEDKFSKNSGGGARSARSARRYKEVFKNANGDPMALQPKWSNCGNRDPRLAEAHRSHFSDDP